MSEKTEGTEKTESGKEKPAPPTTKRIFQIKTGTKDSYESTIFIGGREFPIVCKKGVIATEHQEIANHFAKHFGYTVEAVGQQGDK